MRSHSILLVASAALALMGCNQHDSSHTATASTDSSLRRVQAAGVLRWGGDVVGGIPYAYEDPTHPGHYIGFEVDIANAVASKLGVRAELVIRAWDTLIPELQRGTFDMAMNGLETTAERARLVDFSEPYFVYAQQLTVRKGVNSIRSLKDVFGKKVATLSGSAAEDILRATPKVEAVICPEITYSYKKLQQGEVDAVLLDSPIAMAYGASNPALHNVGQSFGEGFYGIAFRKSDNALTKAVNHVLETMKASGELAGIYRKYNLMDEHQSRIGIKP